MRFFSNHSDTMKLYPLILSALLLVPFSLSHANAPTANKTVAANFKKDSAQASHRGRIRSYQVHEYHFYGTQGQRLKAVITGNVVAYLRSDALEESISLDEYSPDLDANGEYTLPHTGQYSIHIGQMRAMARRGKKPNYTLTITLR